MAWKKGTAAAFASFAYTYSPRGQRLTATEVTGREATYGYDAASRLASETITGDPSGPTGNGALTYSLDPVGNRLSRASTLAALTAQSFEYDANDELTSDTYDLNGNTTGSGGHTYSYDFENRLVSKDGGAVTIVYDGDGNRVAKAGGGVTTQYLVDELNPTGYLQVMDEVSGGAVQVRYTFGNVLVSQARNESGTFVPSFYGYDAHGNVAFLTDAAGTDTDSYNYDAWGVITGAVGSTLNTRLYDGEEIDPDLGLINLRARYYDSTRGRFTSRDSDTADRSRPASASSFVFANADPTNLGDPTGHDAVAGYGLLLAAVAAALVVEEVVRIGGERGTTTINVSGTAGVAGAITACRFASATIGTAAVLGVYNLCTKRCPPCPPPPPPRIDRDHSHHPCPGAHMHTFVMNQNPATCQCFVGKGPVICL